MVRGAEPPPPPRNLINCYHGFPLGFVSTELQRKKKNLIGLDLSHEDDSAQWK